MRIAWKLRMAAAQHEVWTGAQLRRLLGPVGRGHPIVDAVGVEAVGQRGRSGAYRPPAIGGVEVERGQVSRTARSGDPTIRG